MNNISTIYMKRHSINGTNKQKENKKVILPQDIDDPEFTTPIGKLWLWCNISFSIENYSSFFKQKKKKIEPHRSYFQVFNLTSITSYWICNCQRPNKIIFSFLFSFTLRYICRIAFGWLVSSGWYIIIFMYRSNRHHQLF